MESQIFLGAQIAKFGPQLFLAAYSPNRICVPYLKSPASMVAKISRRSNIFEAVPLAQNPVNFGPNDHFLQATPIPSCVKKSLYHKCIYDDGNGMFSSKKTNLCNAKLRDFGPNRGGSKNSSSKMLYLESPTMICLFTIQRLWGYDDYQGIAYS